MKNVVFHSAYRRIFFVLCLSALSYDLLPCKEALGGQEKRERQERVSPAYDLLVEFNADAACVPPNGPYFSRFSFQARFQRVRFVFPLKEEERTFSIRKTPKRGEAEENSQDVYGSGKLLVADLCHWWSPDGRKTYPCTFTRHQDVFTPILIALARDEIPEDALPWPESKKRKRELPQAPYYILDFIAFFQSYPSVIEWKCEQTEAEFSMSEFEVLLPLDKRRLLSGEEITLLTPYEWEGVPSPGLLRITLRRSGGSR